MTQMEIVFIGGISFTYIVLLAFALFCRYMANREKRKDYLQEQQHLRSLAD